jgi:endonuclease YncB( thermonuclease family)
MEFLMSRSRRKRAPRRTDIWPRVWRRRPVVVGIALLLAVAVAWVRLTRPGGSDFDRYHNRSFTCLRVIHGDSLEIAARDGRRATTRVRLLGVDAPKARVGEEPLYFSAEAEAFVRARVEGGTVRVVLPPDRTRDHYGRLLAYVYPGGSDDMLNEKLITTGHVYADPRFPHPWKERFIVLEERSRKRGEGLWQEVRPEQMPAWRYPYEEWREAHSVPVWD